MIERVAQELKDQISFVRECKDEKSLIELALSTKDPIIALEISRSQHVTVKVLDVLLKHPSIVVRHNVAKSTNLSESQLNTLVKDEDMLVRDYAIRNLMNRK
jgi:hypothetical protein